MKSFYNLLTRKGENKLMAGNFGNKSPTEELPITILPSLYAMS